MFIYVIIFVSLSTLANINVPVQNQGEKNGTTSLWEECQRICRYLPPTVGVYKLYTNNAHRAGIFLWWISEE